MNEEDFMKEFVEFKDMFTIKECDGIWETCQLENCSCRDKCVKGEYNI